MTFAFLFLTYDNFTHPDVVWNFVKTENVYIHPKYPERVIPKFKPFIIDSLCKTNWGESSIVDATINLLKESYSTTENMWFVLLSEDSYPLHSFDTFKTRFKRSSSGEKSLFHLINTYGDITKTSQWWILHRNDVKIILDNDDKYRKKFYISKKSDGAYDEFYFLSLLKWVNPNHLFEDKMVMYDNFQKYTIQKNPKIFNKFIKYDENEIEINESFFIRKVTPEFTLKTYKTKNNLIVVFIGTETDQESIRPLLNNDGLDIIILSSIKVELVNIDILHKSICVIQIIYKFHLETILSLCADKYLSVWNSVLFTTENFDLSYPYILDNLPNKNLPIIGESKLKNVDEFKHVIDGNGNIAFHRIIKRNNSLKKKHIPSNKYFPNLTTTMKDWESPPYYSRSSSSNYRNKHSPEESPPFTLSHEPLTLSQIEDKSTPSPPFVPHIMRPQPSPPFVPIMPPKPFVIPKCIKKDIFIPKRVMITVKKLKHKNLKSPSKKISSPAKNTSSPAKKVSSPAKKVSSPEKNTSSPEDIALPDGMTLKISKKCAKGSKTHKFHDKIVCKRVELITHEGDDSRIEIMVDANPTLPNGMTLKIKKKCAKGLKTHKYHDKIVCKKTVV